MYKVLIADDEEKICFLIHDIIHWDELDLQIVGFASTGKIALDKIETLSPDIVITDIRMPELDGLELISEIYTKKPEVSFIVISGYRQFEYATSAIKFGVEDYLLKPIREDELNETLRKICERKKMQQKVELQNQLLREEIMDARQERWGRLIELLLTQNSFPITWSSLNKKYSCNFLYKKYYCILIKTDISFYHIEDPNINFINLHILDLVKEYFSDWIDTMIFYNKGMYIFFIINYDQDESQLKEITYTLFESIDKYVMTFDCYTSTMSISFSNSLADLPKSLQSAKELLNARIINGVRQILTEKTCKFLPILFTQEELDNKIEKLNFYLNRLDFSHYVCSAEQLFTELENLPKTSSKYYRYFAQQITSTLSKQLADSFPRFSPDEIERDCLRIMLYADNARTTTEFSQYVIEILRKITDKYTVIKRQQGIFPIRIAKEYINCHLTENITMADVAKQSGLSASYFSVVFKQETGVNFKDYLTQQRMEKAKHLLQTTNDLIPNIAKSVGYTDARYFSSQFQKIVGLKPAKYRKLHS